MLGFGVTLAATGFASSLTAFYVMYAVVGVACAGANSVGYLRTISTWFDRRRGLAIGIASAGMGLGFALIPAYTQLLLNLGGLHAAFLGLGAIVLLVGVPVVAFSSRTVPASTVAGWGVRAPADPGATQDLPGATAREAMRMPQFWALLGAFLLVAGAIFAMALHLVSAVRDIDPCMIDPFWQPPCWDLQQRPGGSAQAISTTRYSFPMSRQASLSVAPSAH